MGVAYAFWIKEFPLRNSGTSGCFEDPAFFAYLLFDLASFSFFIELLGVTTVPAVQRISDLYPQYV